MALLSQQLQRFFLTTLGCTSNLKATRRNSSVSLKDRARCCSAIAIDAPSSLSDVTGIRWGLSRLKGPREEMEDDAIIRSDGLDGFSFAAVFDGHAGFSSVKFLRDELYKECLAALEGGLLLREKKFNTIRVALERAFESADTKLLNWLETTGEEVESGSTATVMLIRDNAVFISHVGDSCVVLSRSGKEEVLTSPHRPYGSNQSSLQEIRRIREAGGWISNGRICGDIAVSRAFGDMRFKTKKKEMLEKGLEEGRWSQKFISRVQFTGDLVVASPDVFQVSLGSDAEFLLLASDGLWDYMNSSEAVTFVRNQLRQHADVQAACEALALAALDRGSQDNVSIIIADLGYKTISQAPTNIRRTDWQSLPQQQQNLFLELVQALATVGIVTLGIWMSSQFGL